MLSDRFRHDQLPGNTPLWNNGCVKWDRHVLAPKTGSWLHLSGLRKESWCVGQPLASSLPSWCRLHTQCSFISAAVSHISSGPSRSRRRDVRWSVSGSPRDLV